MEPLLSRQQPDLVLVTARQLELVPGIEHEEILAVLMRTQFLDAGKVDDRRTVYTLETL